MNIIKHAPALQVVIPFLGAMLAALSFNKRIAWIIAILAVLSIFILSVLSIKTPDISYSFGDWPQALGIEYSLTCLNKSIILAINGILLIFLCFYKKLIDESILNYIQNKWQSLFFVLLLFAHSGYIGIVSTNDIFNLYVFIEISSIAAYVLMALGNNRKAPIGALHYLIFGSIGATFILISIGFLFSITGHLNFTEITIILSKSLENHPGYQTIFNTGVIFYVIGALLKISFFPIHFWMEKSYKYASSVILIYLASISSIIGVYILIKFLFFVGDYNDFTAVHNVIITGLYPILIPITAISILLSSIIAMRSTDLSKIIVYGILLNVAYAILFLVIPEGRDLVMPLLFIDSITKVGLFSIQSYANSKNCSLYKIHLWKYLTIIIIFSSAGLPLTPMFLIKIKMLKTLFTASHIYLFLIVLISFVMSIFYHYKMIKLLFSNIDYIKSLDYTTIDRSDELADKEGQAMSMSSRLVNPDEVGKFKSVDSGYSLILVIIIQFLLLINFDTLFKPCFHII